MKQFVIPDIYCPFPSLMSPYLEQVREHNIAWARRFGLIQEERTLRYYLALNAPQGACGAYVNGGLEELCLICDWICWGFFYDDQFDYGEHEGQLMFMRATHDHLQALLQDSPGVSPQGPVALAFYDVWQRACKLTSSTWQRRFARHHQHYFAGQKWEAENRAHQHIPDMQTYISKRRDTGAAPVCSDFIELLQYSPTERRREEKLTPPLAPAGKANLSKMVPEVSSSFAPEVHFEIPPQIYESQSVQAVLQAAQNIVMRYNDVYSLQKDLTHGEVQNLVVIVWQEQDCSLQQAVNQVCAMIETETRHFHDLVQRLPTYPSPVDRLMRNYVVDLGIWMRGTLDWHREALRYGEMQHSKPGNYLEEILPIE